MVSGGGVESSFSIYLWSKTKTLTLTPKSTTNSNMNLLISKGFELSKNYRQLCRKQNASSYPNKELKTYPKFMIMQSSLMKTFCPVIHWIISSRKSAGSGSLKNIL